MMLLSRFWYAILAVALAASVGLLYLGIHQHNRHRERDTNVIIEHDRDIIDYFLRVDAQARLSTLAIASVNDQVRNSIQQANTQDKLAADLRDNLRKRLDDLAKQYATMLRDEGRGGQNPNALLAVDARGRVVAWVNFDRDSMIPNKESFELGGFPVVADALHGWLRDDTWVLDRESIYRVVARPIVVGEGSQVSGAIVALRRVDDTYAKLVADQTNAPVLFYVAAPDGDSVKPAARAIPGKSDLSFDGFSIDPRVLASDKSYQDDGLSSAKVQGGLTVAYARLIGEGWGLGAGYLVGRKVVPIEGPSALLAGADESDRKAVPVGALVAITLVALLIGILTTFTEHSRPTQRLLQEALKLGRGDQDGLPLARLTGPYRRIAQHFNDGIERMATKGGGTTRKAADLEQILGPVPATPQMSAFSFNFGGSASTDTAAADNLSFALPPVTGANPVAQGSAAAPPPPPSRPSQAQGGGVPPSAKANMPVLSSGTDLLDDEDETKVASIPEELRSASRTGEQSAIAEADESVHWRQTFEAFAGLRKKLGEPTSGLSYEKFEVQLRKNKEQLVKQFNCRRVKFTVYEKDGKAALKATPIKE